MTKRVELCEAVAKPSLGLDGLKWRVKVISPGQGSSGKYAQEMLEAFIPDALPVGSHSYVDHPEEDENGTPKRSPKDLMATVSSVPAWDDVEQAMVAELDVLPHWKNFVEAVAPHTGLSIYMVGDQDDDGNVTALHPDTFNTLDLVSYAGRGGGMIEKLYEAARAHTPQGNPIKENSVGKASAEDTEGNSMDYKELADKLDALVEAITGRLGEFATVIESLKPEVPSDDAVDYLAVAENVTAEESLTPKLRKMVFESIRAGKSEDEALAEAKEIAAEFVVESKDDFEQDGRRNGTLAEAKSVLPVGW